MNSNNRCAGYWRQLSFSNGLFNYLAASLTLVLLINSSWIAFATSSAEPLKVGLVFAGSSADLDWNYAHDQGRRYLEKALKNKVEVNVAEKVPESAEVERVMEKMIAKGTKLIFSTSYGY